MPGSTIEVYGYEDSDGNVTDENNTTQNIVEAREHAQKYGLRVIAYEYEYADSSLVEDYTATADDGDDDA